MIKASVEQKKGVQILASGSPAELLDDLSNLVNGIYRQTAKSNSDVAAAFKAVFQLMVADKNSPLWDLEARESETGISMVIPNNKGGE